MLTHLDNYYDAKEEPMKGCLLALRNIILNHNSEITEVWKYKMPFFCFRERMFCYLWVHKKTDQPYMGVMGGSKMVHPKLITTKNTKVKKMMFHPEKDLPLKDIETILNLAIDLHLQLPKLKRKNN